MKVFLSTTNRVQRILQTSFGITMIAVASAFTFPVAAQEPDTPAVNDSAGVPDKHRVQPNPLPATFPTRDPNALPEDVLVPRPNTRFPNTPFGMDPFGNSQEKQVELQMQATALNKQIQELQQKYGANHPAVLQAKQATERVMREMQSAAARDEMARAVALLQLGKLAVAPLPDDAITRVFTLKNGQAKEIAAVIDKIVGDRPVRMAVDERTNALIVSGNENSCSIVEALVMKLDQPGNPSAERQAGETLQLRIIWLLDGVSGIPDPKPELVSLQVVEALRELGFESPKVVCQQVTTLTLGQDNRRGQFQFEIPVLVSDQVWQFQGQGTIASTMDERFALEFRLQVKQPNNPQGSQLGGSIYSPLSHYTVMGTTTFVAATVMPTGDGGQTEQQEQHLSAFVVYLDRAREFSGKSEKPAAKGASSPEKSPFDK